MKWPHWTEDTSYCSPYAKPGWRLRTGRIAVALFGIALATGFLVALFDLTHWLTHWLTRALP